MKTWLPIHHEYWQQCLDLLAAHVPARKTDTIVYAGAVEDTATAIPTEFSGSSLSELNVGNHIEAEAEVSLSAAPFSSSVVSEEPILEQPTVEIPEGNAPELLEPETSTTAFFFAALPWDGELVTPLVARAPTEPILTTTSDQFSIETAKGFFLKVPWDGPTDDADDEIESVHVSAVYADDGLDPRSGAFEGASLLSAGLMSAARTSDRIEKREAKAPLSTSSATKHYFAAIPWNN